MMTSRYGVVALTSDGEGLAFLLHLLGAHLFHGVFEIVDVQTRHLLGALLLLHFRFACNMAANA